MAMKTEAAIVPAQDAMAWMAEMWRDGEAADSITFFAILVAACAGQTECPFA